MPVYEYGEHLGNLYLVTPYVANGSLTDLLKRRGRLHHAEVLDVLQQVVAGLAYAHERGFVHGALKPSHIVLSNQSQILVAGFGLKILIVRGGDSKYVYLADSSRLNMQAMARDTFIKYWAAFAAVVMPK